MTDTKLASERLVRDFLGSWEGRDLETICGAFADDAVYHNVPVKPIEGIVASARSFRRSLARSPKPSSMSSRWQPSRVWYSPSASTTSP